MEDKKNEDPITKATRMYLEQAKRNAPKLKNAVEDWQKIYIGFLDASFKAQKSALKNMGIENQFVDQIEEMVRSSSKIALEFQKKLTEASIEITLKTAQSFLDKNNKS